MGAVDLRTPGVCERITANETLQESTASAEFTVGPRDLKSWDEYQHWYETRKYGFSDWYIGRPSRVSSWQSWHVANIKARLFPDYLHEARNKDGQLVAYLATCPGYWPGDPAALQDFNYYDDLLKVSRSKALTLAGIDVLSSKVPLLEKLFESRAQRLRETKLTGSNCIVLLAITVDPVYQKMRLPQLLLSHTIATAQRLGLKYVVGPFRPNAYGAYKASRKLAHSNDLFEKYCKLCNQDGLPQDPWLRTVTRLGARFLKIEPQSFRIAKTIPEFENFRSRHRANHWYSPSTDVWECGETPTWYIDRYKKQVISVEPNLWGAISVPPLPASKEQFIAPDLASV